MAVNPLSPFVAANAAPVTPSDTQDITFMALYVGGTGNVAVITANGQTVTFNAVPVGFFPVAGTRVMATGTTATNLIALF